MKNVLKKSLMLSTLGVASVSVAGCFGGGDSGNDSGPIEINFTAGNAQRHLTYNQENPLTLPDGSVVANGELKPTWQYIEKTLDIEVQDDATNGQKASEMMSLGAADNFADSDIYGGSGIAESLMNYGAVDGSFHNLSEHLDKMPNYSKYLKENPGSKSAYTAADGNMYHIGYTAEVGSYARAFNGRVDWIQVILDGKGEESEWEWDAEVDSASKVSIKYKGSSQASADDKKVYHGKDDMNVNEYRDAVIAHLKTKHNVEDNAKLSEVFTSVNATYDMEDLVALWRIMAAAKGNMSAASNGGTPVSDAVISPFFVRRQSYRDDVLRLANYFEGQRVFGADSYGSRFYLDSKGELQFSHTQEKFLDSVDFIAQLFSEGLIHQDINVEGGSTNIRSEMYASDYADDHKSFGFMTFDWFASTTNTTADKDGEKEYKIDGILPPMVTMEGGTKDVHWVDNGRAIKPDGWAIASHVTGDKLDEALKLMDWFFTEEGHKVQNYGTPDMWGKVDYEFEDAEGDITTYTAMSDWTKKGANDNSNGDGSAFLRDYVGSILPIGYGKEIGLELQYTSDKGIDAWALYRGANVLFAAYDNENDMLNMIAPIFALGERDKTTIDDMNIGEDEQDKIWLYITGASGAEENTDAIKALYEAKSIQNYINIHKAAYDKVTKG